MINKFTRNFINYNDKLVYSKIIYESHRYITVTK